MRFDGEAALARGGAQAGENGLGRRLDHGAAAAADGENRGRLVRVVAAGHIGIERLDAMHQPERQEPVEGAIDRGRRLEPVPAQPVQELIGRERPPLGPELVQDHALVGRQLRLRLTQEAFSACPTANI